MKVTIIELRVMSSIVTLACEATVTLVDVLNSLFIKISIEVCPIGALVNMVTDPLTDALNNTAPIIPEFLVMVEVRATTTVDFVAGIGGDELADVKYALIFGL